MDIKLNILVNKNKITGVGNIGNKKGYQKVDINIDYLRDAIDFLSDYEINDDYCDGFVSIFVKKNHPVQIGTENIGFIIAPRNEVNHKNKFVKERVK